MYSTHCILNIKLTKLKIPLCRNSSKINTLTCIYKKCTWVLTFLAWYRHFNRKWWRWTSFMGPTDTCTQFNANKITIRHLDLILRKNTGSSSTFIQQIQCRCISFLWYKQQCRSTNVYFFIDKIVDYTLNIVRFKINLFIFFLAWSYVKDMVERVFKGRSIELFI